VATSSFTFNYTALTEATFNLWSQATSSGATKTINIGTSGATGSTTNVTIGSASGTSVSTINGTLVVGINGSGYTPPTVSLAGMGIVWNKNGNGSGATYFQNYRQAGTGGFVFELYNTNGISPSLVATPLSINGSGISNFSQRIIIDSANDINSAYSIITKNWIAINNDRVASGFARNWGIHTNNGVEGSLEFFVGASELANPSVLALSITRDKALISESDITAKGSLLSTSSTGGIGYGAGAGGEVTQITSKDTNVTLNKISGKITMNNAALAAGATVSFYVFNSTVGIRDVVVATAQDGFSGNYLAQAYLLATGAFAIRVTNTSGSSQSEAAIINFVVIKAVSS
jgi:hypothetical protein